MVPRPEWYQRRIFKIERGGPELIRWPLFGQTRGGTFNQNSYSKFAHKRLEAGVFFNQRNQNYSGQTNNYTLKNFLKDLSVTCSSKLKGFVWDSGVLQIYARNGERWKGEKKLNLHKQDKIKKWTDNVIQNFKITQKV